MIRARGSKAILNKATVNKAKRNTVKLQGKVVATGHIQRQSKEQLEQNKEYQNIMNLLKR